ncbi:MAG: helix-turn-helix transcriptional regulator [Mogibacterium sp.]|nr:helix-turn-helix transcriptional regulator [Mogibacterium sp.]MBQ6501631.1 helix-turn-helix transcriptional regulator [Mogibacterium sp.]
MRKRVDDNMYNIGSNIRTARKRADLTQEELSERLGVTPQYLSDLERGLVGTSISTLIKICTELNVSSDFILFGSSRDTDTANSTLIEKFQRLPKHKAEIVERYIDFVFEIMDMDPNQRTGK